MAFVVLGLLTVFKSPDWAPWQLALLAGEYGHWLALPPLALLLLPWCLRGPMPVKVATVGLTGVAAGLLLKPSLQAKRVARTLPERFSAAFPSWRGAARPPFTYAGFFAPAPKPVAMRTLTFSGDLTLDFYAPAKLTTAPVPCVIVVHGGGWDSGDKHEIPGLNHALAQSGYAVAAISYRLAPRFPWPAQREDVLAAIAFLKAHAAELGLDPMRLVLLGRSAGGQIAEAVAYGVHDPAIRGVIGLYSPADLEFAWTYAREDDVLKSPQLMRQFLGGDLAARKEAYRDASGYFKVDARTPPTLLLHGELDVLVWHRQSERLAARLSAEHVPQVFVSLPWATHAFEYNLRGPGGQIALWAIQQFLAAVVP